MDTKIRQIGMGLLFGLFAVVGNSGQAQITKAIKNATESVTQPLKDVQKTTQSVTDPVRDVSRGVKDVTRAPQDVKNEIGRTTNEIDRAKNDISNVGNDVKRAKGDLSFGNRKGNTRDTSATPTRNGSNRTVVIDERRDREEVKDTPLDISKNPELPQSTGKTTTKAPDPFRVRPPLEEPAPAPSSGNRSVEVVPAGSIVETPPRRVKPDYRNSPAQYALERAEFDTETLYDLFEGADWEGPGREHTIRSIGFTLKQLKNDIAEVKQIDSGADTSYFEKHHKAWYAEFTRRTREEPVKNEAIIQDL
ncbi:MAG: hypothetical protein AAGN35_17135 [Bacteroidota bacterium]